MEGVRARGNARLCGQRGDSMLDREHRSDGRAHGRFDHRRAGDDVDRSRIPADAGRRRGGDSGDRRRGRWLQHPVRDQPRRRRDARDRDESARVPLLRARLEGDRIPDRADWNEAGRRLPSRRDSERHHRHDAGFIRAGARLRGGQVPAFRVRKIPGRESPAHHADEIRRRVDGHRAHFQGSVSESPARSRDGAPGMDYGDDARRRPSRG